MKWSLLICICFILGSKGKVLKETDTSFSFEDDNDNSVDKEAPPRERINLSYPGTRWCGPGNTADDYDDLGAHPEEDKCCRRHDHCDNMASHESKYNLTNDDYFTRLHCRCDKEFHDCLKSVNSTLAQRIGSFYFNIRDKCYKEQHPIMDCAEEKHKFFIRRCVKYIVDKSKPRLWQWFDLPFYDDDQDFGVDFL
uniref:Phospholipase A2 n=1 Tax=Culicoides sonorensis TaxID=179676 RepID=A0A336LI29_CULSO